MKIALLLATCATATAIAAPEMSARFQNGDQLNGQLTDIREGDMLWKSDSFFETQTLKLDQVIDISLPASEILEAPEGDHIAIATLTNGDQVRGTLLRVTDKEIGLLTNFAGELIFRRDMVDALDIQERPETYYNGPTSIEEWTQSEEDSWSFSAGSLVCDGPSSIAKDVGKHTRFRIAFDVEWRNKINGFSIYTCADNIDLNEVENSFELVCQSQSAYMRKRIKRNGRSEFITVGHIGIAREFREREKVRFQILHDLENNRIRLMLGDRIVADWRDPAPNAKLLGGNLHFVSSSSAPLRISRIQVSSWEGVSENDWIENAGNINILGRFNNAPEEEPEEEIVDESGIILRNGDRIEGETLDISDGKVTLKTAFKEFQLPVSRLRTFALRTSEEAADYNLRWEPIIRNGDIRATFIEGGHITFQLTDFGKDSVKGKSQTFGEAEFRLSAFNRLEFNLYRPEYLETRNADNW